MTIKELAKKTHLKPAIIRSRLRRELKHERGARWELSSREFKRALTILKKQG